MSEIGDRRPIYRRLRDQLAAEIARNTDQLLVRGSVLNEAVFFH